MYEQEVVEHIRAGTSLSAAEASRVIEDVLSYFDEQVPDYVRRRHAELKRQGMKNVETFEALQREARARRFAIPELSHRQIRRLIYG